MTDWEPLIAAATTARRRSHAPYSGFAVGAAILMEDGSIHAGCNVENRSYGATVCAERVALGAALAAGGRRPRAVAVVADAAPPARPCGMCLQVLSELGDPNLPILLGNLGGQRDELRLADLLPQPFVLPPGRGRTV
jgi:cytidine deaminase